MNELLSYGGNEQDQTEQPLLQPLPQEKAPLSPRQTQQTGGYTSRALNLLGKFVPITSIVRAHVYASLPSEQPEHHAQDAVMISSYSYVDNFAKDVALQFTMRYQEQISLLCDKSPKELADFIIYNIINFLESGHIDNKVPLVPQLLDAIAYQNLRKNISEKPVLQTATQGGGGGQWTCRGVLQKTGIVLSDGRKYWHEAQPESKVVKYKYRLGTEEEVTKYNWIQV